MRVVMKKSTASLIVISLLFCYSIPAFASTIEGTKCVSLGTTKITSGNSFRCTNVNGKSIWVREKIANSNQVDTKIPSTLTTLFNAYSQIQKIKNSKADPTLALDIRYSPTVNKTYASKLLSGVSDAARFWQNIFLPSKPMPVIVFTEKDHDWFKDQLSKIGVTGEMLDRKVAQFDSEAKRTATRMNWAGMNGFEDKKWFEFSVGTDLGTSKLGAAAKDFELGNLKVGPHEYTHAAQFAAIDGPNMDYSPCWFTEGGAEFYGMLLGAKNLEILKQMRQNQVWEKYYLDFPGMAFEPKIGWEKFLDNNGTIDQNPGLKNSCGPNGAYPVGATATQYLFELKGQEGIEKFMSQIKETKDWKKSIAQVYGISWDQMKVNISNYIRLIVSQTPKP